MLKYTSVNWRKGTKSVNFKPNATTGASPSITLYKKFPPVLAYINKMTHEQPYIPWEYDIWKTLNYHALHNYVHFLSVNLNGKRQLAQDKVYRPNTRAHARSTTTNAHHLLNSTEALLPPCRDVIGRGGLPADDTTGKEVTPCRSRSQVYIPVLTAVYIYTSCAFNISHILITTVLSHVMT